MSAWTDEYAPPSLVALGRGVRSAFGLSADAIGMKGDENHLSGYHRSRRWIMTDGDGSGDYSARLPLDQGGDANWICALDASLDKARMIAVSTRMITAMRNRDPRVAAVREFYGTLDGRVVTGWDAATGRTVSSDDSHLWHGHTSFYRSLAGDDHSGVLDVMLGNPLEDDDMTEEQMWDIITGVTYGSTRAGVIEEKAPVGVRPAAKFTIRALSTRMDAFAANEAARDAAEATRSAATLAAVKALAVATGQDPEAIAALIREESEKTRAAVLASLARAAQAEADALKG